MSECVFVSVNFLFPFPLSILFFFCCIHTSLVRMFKTFFFFSFCDTSCWCFWSWCLLMTLFPGACWVGLFISSIETATLNWLSSNSSSKSTKSLTNQKHLKKRSSIVKIATQLAMYTCSRPSETKFDFKLCCLVFEIIKVLVLLICYEKALIWYKLDTWYHKPTQVNSLLELL